MNTLTLEERTALVTGASSGLGRRAAEVLHEAGATVILAARRIDRLEGLVAKLGPRAVAVACDISTGTQVEALFERVDTLGSLEVVVSAAGISDAARAETQTRSDFAKVLEVNLVAAFDIATHAARRMLPAGRGSIINVASTAGFQPVPFMTTYAATKAFVLSFSEALWEEARDTGVHVSCLCPGPTASKFRERAGTGKTRLGKTSKVIVAH